LPSTRSSATPPEATRPRRGSSRRTALVAGLLALLIAAGAVIYAVSTNGGTAATTRDPRESQVATPGVASVGKDAPAFDLRTLDGKRVQLAALRGRPVIVNFWASWCAPCRQEFPLLKDALAKYRKDRLAVVGVVYQDIPDDARAFAKQMKATWPLGVDGDRSTALAYGVRAIPQTFFITPNGVINQRIFGLRSAEGLDREIDRIVPAKTTTTTRGR
jgi:cytochrome c biogenesis protein CcmG, thiol:disulfide interchange protein DsbE